MRYVIVLYYLFYVLIGGYRHFSFEADFFANVYSLDIPQFGVLLIKTGEALLLGLALWLVFRPNQKYIHLLFFGLLFILDLLFQNLRFSNSVILTHIFPLFCFLFLHFQDKKRVVQYGAILLVSIGFLIAFSGKIFSDWLDPNSPVIYSYIVQFNLGYDIPLYLSNYFMSINNFHFYKLLDYSVLIFQSVFIINFVTHRYFIYLSIIAVLFHIGILLSLGIGAFFPYILFYALIISYTDFRPSVFQQKFFFQNSYLYGAICCLIFLVAMIYGGQFFMAKMPFAIYLHHGLILNIVSILLFAQIIFQYYKNNRTLLFK